MPPMPHPQAAAVNNLRRGPRRRVTIVLSYLLVSAATLARLAASLAPAELAPALLLLSGLFWLLAFAAFAIRLGPALLQPRANGRPG
jgi:uncharacterized protein involved in response to NO